MKSADEQIPTHTEQRSRKQIREKWGDGIGRGGNTGFLALPEALIRGQKRLQLNSTEMMVLINVLMHWWYADRAPFPSNQRIADRMGIDQRTVQRAIQRMESIGLVERDVRRFYDDKNNVHSAQRHIKLDGLVSRVKEISADLLDFNAQVAATKEHGQDS